VQTRRHLMRLNGGWPPKSTLEKRALSRSQ
jgi:hypothetical protein